MKKLVEQSADAATEKHVPVIEKVDGGIERVILSDGLILMRAELRQDFPAGYVLQRLFETVEGEVTGVVLGGL